MPAPAHTAMARPPMNNAKHDMIRRIQKRPWPVRQHQTKASPPQLGGPVTRYSLANDDRRPLTIGDEIRENYDGDVDAWIAAVLQLPVEYVREKIAQATRPEAAA